jgi:hypothetical protein
MKAKAPSYKFFLKPLEEESSIGLKPKKIGSIPKMAVLLGLLSPQFYDIYLLCDGDHDISTIAKQLKLQPDQARIYVDKLARSKMIEL